MSLDWSKFEALRIDGKVSVGPDGINPESSNRYQFDPRLAYMPCLKGVHQPLDHFFTWHGVPDHYKPDHTVICSRSIRMLQNWYKPLISFKNLWKVPWINQALMTFRCSQSEKLPILFKITKLMKQLLIN